MFLQLEKRVWLTKLATYSISDSEKEVTTID